MGKDEVEEQLQYALYCRAMHGEHAVQLFGTPRQKQEAENYLRLCALALSAAREERNGQETGSGGQGNHEG